MDLKKIIIDNITPMQLFKNLKYRMAAAGAFLADPEFVSGGLQFRFFLGDNSETIVLEEITQNRTGVDLSLVIDREMEGFLLSMIPEAGVIKSAEPSDFITGKYNLGSSEIILGLDEAGKSDYFGPLIITGVVVQQKDISELFKLTLKDPSLYSGDMLAETVAKITDMFPTLSVIITPDLYNEMFIRHKDMNLILMKAHAKAILSAVEKYNVSTIIVDRFGDEDISTDIIGNVTLRIINPSSDVKHPVVSAAAAISHFIYLRELEELGTEYRQKLPKGTGDDVVSAAKSFIKSYGLENLFKVSKVNFRLTGSLL
jgi:ribonuclease HIII